jgi:hypothetical protein
MKDLFALIEMRDLFMVAIGIGMTIGLYFIFTGIHDAVWYARDKRRPFDGFKGGRL